MNKYLKKEQLIALLLTLLFAALTITLLVSVHLSTASASIPKAQNPQDEEIFFADIEYQEITTNPTLAVDNQPASAAAAEISGTDMTDAGSVEETPTLVSAEKPSEAKVVKPEERKPAPGPTQEENPDPKSSNRRANMGSQFARANNPSETGTGAADSGNASAGNNPGADGLGLAGRKRLNSADPGIKNATGKVKVKVTVNAEGNVVSANIVESSGFANENEVRNACIAASKKLKYSPDPNKPAQTGIITWNIR